MRFGCAWDWDHALSLYPCQCYLWQGAPFAYSELLDFREDVSVLVEVFALKFGYCKQAEAKLCSVTVLVPSGLAGTDATTQRRRLTRASEVVWCEVIRTLEGEVVNQPAVTEGTVGAIHRKQDQTCAITPFPIHRFTYM